MERFRLPLCISLASLLLAATAYADEGKTKTRPLMKDFMGINGHTISVNPDQVTPVCRLIRDYHNIGWDVLDDTSADTQFPLAKQKIEWQDTSGKWKSFSGVPNWQEIYGSWKKAGLEIDVCVQSAGFTFAMWKNPAEDAYRYGKAFAEYFGPSHHALATSIEIDNEPAGTWKAEDYRVIFENMAKGVRAGDPKLTILTATTRAGEADKYSIPIDTFKGLESLYDVINVHTYAFKKYWPTYERSYPEDPSIDWLKPVQETIDWRNKHVPDKQIWITEFGNDACTRTPAEDAQNPLWTDVTDENQAQWNIRSFLEFSSMDVDRAYLYFLNDEDTPTLHESSGILRFFQPKPAYWAMKHLYETLGDYRFSKAVQKTAGDIYIYEYVRGNNEKDRVWVIWSPTGSDRQIERKLLFPGQVVKAERMPLTEGPAPQVDAETLTISESPVYVWLTLP